MINPNQIFIKEGSIEEAVQVHATIPEFDKPADVEFFKNRYQKSDHLILLAYQNENPIGYMIAYDRYKDGSIYCWMAGVDPNYRRNGALKNLMNGLEKWAKENNYLSIRIKTRNRRYGMLNYLIKNHYQLIEVEPK